MQNEPDIPTQPVAVADGIPPQPVQPMQAVTAAAGVVPMPAPAAAVLPVQGPVLVPPAGAALKKSWNDSVLLQKFLDLSFRLGLGMVFIINSITAFVDPEGFEKLINANFLARALGHTDLMLYVITANDLILGLLILLGIKKKYTYAWAGVWLFIVTFIKFTSLV